MRPLLPAALILAALALGGCKEPPPDVVLITVDTLRADRLGAYGRPGGGTPSFDAAAAGGVVFEDASTTMPRTTQAVASLLTSQYPAAHGVLEIGQTLAADQLSIAEALRDAGYLTVGISANPVAGPQQGLDQGFSHFIDHATINSRHRVLQNLDGPNPAGPGPAEAVTQEALTLAGDAGDRPLFMWLLYMDPHWPYNPPAPYNQVVDWSEFSFYHDMRSFNPQRATVYFNLNGRAAAARSELGLLYDAEVRYTDAMVGRLLAGLDERRPGRRRLVVITADHGESLGENGYFYQHGALVDQPCMHVPLIMSLPGSIPRGRRVPGPVSLVDVAPTILSLTGVTIPDHFAGRDLSPVWSDGGDGRSVTVSGESGSIAYPQNPIRRLGGRASLGLRFLRDGRFVAVSEHGEHRLYDVEVDPALQHDLASQHPEESARLFGQLAAVPAGGDRWRMVRDGGWKLVRIPTGTGAEYRLFDLHRDPGETVDLAADHPQVVARLEALLDTAPNIIDAAPPAALVSEDVRRQLQALGYADE